MPKWRDCRNREVKRCGYKQVGQNSLLLARCQSKYLFTAIALACAKSDRMTTFAKPNSRHTILSNAQGQDSPLFFWCIKKLANFIQHKTCRHSAGCLTDLRSAVKPAEHRQVLARYGQVLKTTTKQRTVTRTTKVLLSVLDYK